MPDDSRQGAFRFADGSPAGAAHRFCAEHFAEASTEERRHLIYLQGMLKHLEVGEGPELPPTAGRIAGAGALESLYRRRLKRRLRRLEADVILGWRKCKPGEATFVEEVVAALLATRTSVLLVHDGDFPRPLAKRLQRRFGERLALLSALPGDLVSRKSFELFLDGREYREFREWLAAHEASLSGYHFRSGLGWFFARNTAFRVFAECLAEVMGSRLLWVRDSASPLNAYLLEEFKRAGAPTVSMQACLIGAPFAETLPFMGDVVFTFGSTSADVIRAAAARIPEQDRPGRIVPLGSWIDPLPAAPVDTFACQRVLIISQESSYFESYFGVGRLIAMTRTIAERLLAAGIEVVLRPHPDGVGLSKWHPLMEAYPDRFSISHNGYPIHYDFIRSSAVLGLFSTAMPAAAAYGIPTFFLDEEGEHYTPEMACFGSACGLTEDSAVAVIERLLRDRDDHRVHRERALEAAARYFEGTADAAEAVSLLHAGSS